MSHWCNSWKGILHYCLLGGPWLEEGGTRRAKRVEVRAACLNYPSSWREIKDNEGFFRLCSLAHRARSQHANSFFGEYNQRTAKVRDTEEEAEKEGKKNPKRYIMELATTFQEDTQQVIWAHGNSLWSDCKE